MATKENKGGLLTNEQVEQDNRVRGKENGAYEGAQDSGDKIPREHANAVQQRDGLPATNESEEE